MINYRRTNALEPEKESVVSLDLMPVVLFGLGFLITRSLIGTLTAQLDTELKVARRRGRRWGRR